MFGVKDKLDEIQEKNDEKLAKMKKEGKTEMQAFLLEEGIRVRPAPIGKGSYGIEEHNIAIIAAEQRRTNELLEQLIKKLDA
ncbi:hypothetical protein [Haladaptatus salinisoli]|uniref:hypothetical protein n=1 Tax=Haladaptatus salinisoli TaxID=2884876 RepID=UPI001D0B5508|nr:hypothetical protein [Haladaptatus salinisoli]